MGLYCHCENGFGPLTFVFEKNLNFFKLFFYIIMSVFVLPKTFCEKISSMIARFWWKSAGRDRGVHWINWKQLKKAKKDGGIGFRDIYAMNLALISKQVWRIENNPNALWVRFLKSLYFPNSSIWDAKKGNNASWGWMSVVKGRDFINKHKAWHIKDGAKVNIGCDMWVHSGVRVWTNQSEVQNAKVKELVLEDGGRWDVQKIYKLFNEDLARSIVATPIHSSLSSDAPFWPYTIDGKYTVSSDYKIAHLDFGESRSNDSTSLNNSSLLWKSIWDAKVQPKIKFFCWRLLSNALPTKANIFRRRMSNDGLSPICQQGFESAEHLFTQCDWVKAAWFGSVFQWTVEAHDVSNIKGWMESRLDDLKQKCGDELDFQIGLFFNMLWSIWLMRNRFVFDSQAVNPHLVFQKAAECNNEFFSATCNVRLSSNSLFPVRNDIGGRWLAPSGNSIKINTDAAFDANLNLGASAAVVRDSDGILLTGSFRKFPCSFPIVAEAVVLKEAIQLAEAIGGREIVVESDCANVVNDSLGKSYHWQIISQIAEIKEVLARNSHIRINWVRRSANKVADLVARLAIRNQLPRYWTWLTPVSVRAALIEDKLVCHSSDPG